MKGNEEEGCITSPKTVLEKLEHNKLRCIERRALYRNCNFIVGSASEIERLRPTCKYILADNLKEMMPLLLGCLVLLNVNLEFCGPDLVSQAMRCPLRDPVSNNIEIDRENERDC